MPFLNPVLVLFTISTLIVIATAIVIVSENQRGAIVRLGRYQKTLKPGLHIRFPFIDAVTKVDLDASIPGWPGLSDRELEAAVESFVLVGRVVRAKPGDRSASASGTSSAEPGTQALAAWLVKTAGEQLGVDLSNDQLAKQRLTERAQSAIEELRSKDSCEIHLPFLTADQAGPKHFSTSLTQASLHEILGAARGRV